MEERGTVIARELTPAEHLQAVKRNADVLAASLVAASDAGVSQAVILPQLMLAFRQAFGEMPAGFKFPGVG